MASCSLLESTPKGGFRNASSSQFKELVKNIYKLEPSKEPQCLHGVKFGIEGSKRWVLAIKNFTKTERKRQEHVRAI